MTGSADNIVPEPERPNMEVDIVGVGFGPAMAGFLSTLSKTLLNEDGTPAIESKAMPGMPLQVLCYERADDIGFGVSGVVTRGRSIRESFPALNLEEIPMAAPVKSEEVLYLLDPHGASRRSAFLRFADSSLRCLKGILPFKDEAFTLPYIPSFLRKDEGMVLSIGQFCQWAGSQILASGTVQVWPGMPVSEPLFEDQRVSGVRLLDQGVEKDGAPTAAFTPGMDIQAALTVVADGPVGPVGRKIDEKVGMPPGHDKFEWAVGTKMVIELRDGVDLQPGHVIHTLGYPEPEIFGFFYVHPENVVSVGIFVPSTFTNPARTSYRYLQHWMQHPAIWKYLEGGTLRSWGAKSIQESGKRGEPYLVGDGFARIGEGSGSTNMLSNSGVDEAWATGVQLAESVVELAKNGSEFTKENLEKTYVKRRRASWVEKEGLRAEKARDGFSKGFVQGLLGMALAGFSGGKLSLSHTPEPPHKLLQRSEEFYKGKLSEAEIAAAKVEAKKRQVPLHEVLMEKAGWPDIPYDGKLLVSQQDALLMGGKVQAAPGYADHVVFTHPEICEQCSEQLCIDICSGEAITTGENGVPAFDREKCVHCGACFWNCSKPNPDDAKRGVVEFRAGVGGLHSGEN